MATAAELEKMMHAEVGAIMSRPIYDALLAALKDIEYSATMIAGLESCGEVEVLNAIASNARAAIAKATGADK